MTTMQTPLTIKQLQEIAIANEAKSGWITGKPLEQTFVEFIALTHSELSEALEDFRANKGLNETWYEDKSGHQKPCGIPSELADVIIRILGFSERAGIDLQSIIEEKLAFNATRPFRHGGKKI